MKAKTYSRAVRAIIAVLFLAGLSAPGAMAQTGEDALRMTERFSGVGARMVGIGGVGLAGIGDAGALLTNPAGFGYFDASEFSGSLNTFSTNGEAQFMAPVTGASPMERDLRDTRLGNLTYVYRAPTVRGSFVFAVGFNQVSTFDRSFLFGGNNASSSVSQSFLPFSDEYEVINEGGRLRPDIFGGLAELGYEAGAYEFYEDLYEDGAYPFEPAAWYGTTVEQMGDVLEEGRLNELSLGGAVEAARGVMVGLSANITFGKYRFDSIFEEVDAEGQNQDYVVEGGQYVGFDRMVYRTGFESSLTGFSVRGGFSAVVAPGVRVGGTIETPTFYSVSEDFYRDLETFFVSGGSLAARDEGNDFEYRITTPWRLGAGIAYDRDALLLAADVTFVDWSQLELDSEYEDFTNENRAIRDALEPVLETRIGAEYRLGSLALRGGFAYHPDPRSDPRGANQTQSVDRSRTFFSAGLGYRFSEQFALDLGWVQERFDDLYRPYQYVDELPGVDQSVVRNRFIVGVRVGF